MRLAFGLAVALLPNRMFSNHAGSHVQDVMLSGGFGQLHKSHTVSFTDFNRDAAQDIYEVLGALWNRVYRPLELGSASTSKSTSGVGKHVHDKP